MKNNYHLVNTCKTCKHHKEIITVDWTYYVCNLDKTYKQIKKYIFEQTDEEVLSFQKWLIDNEVGQNYICDDFENQ